MSFKVLFFPQQIFTFFPFKCPLQISQSFQISKGTDFTCTISRAKFEDLCMDYFKSSMEPVSKVLKDSNIKKSEVSEVIF